MPLALGGTIAAYALLGILLLSLNVTASWRWWIKAGAILLTTSFFAGSYLAISGLLGWPTEARMPARFQVIWGRVVEPDRHSGEQGAIFLWVEELDANNLPSGRPRAHALPYTPELARRIMKVQEQIEDGEDVQGTADAVEDRPKSDVRDKDESEIEEGVVDLDPEAAGRASVTVPFMDTHLELHFQRLPPIILPDKLPF